MVEHEAAPVETNSAIYRKSLDELIALTTRLNTPEGRVTTSIPFLMIVRNSRATPTIPAVLTPAFCLILQGTKRIHFGQDILDCQAGDFLASVIDMPATAQVMASKKSPYMGLRVDFTTAEIASIIAESGLKLKPKSKQPTVGAFIGKSDTGLLELFIRLLKLLDRPGEAPFVSGLIRREMIFHLLSGRYGHLFFQQVFFDGQAAGVGRAIAWIKDNFTRPLSIEELAKSNNMSVSGLHHKFKSLTTMGPLQYQKMLRLQEARRLMLSGIMDATTAALEVGYESPSQFSREYRRLFGLPPYRDIKALRKFTANTTFEVN